MTSPHQVLGGRYRLTSPIAAGGMGEVWRAADELLGRDVAVKLLGRHVAADPAFRDRFRSEARITAALTDPGIAQVFDYGESDDLAYLVMELVTGEPLSAILTRNGALGPDVTLDLIHQTARGLYAAHRAGVIHRDIKPGNLLVTEAGQVKITDFGIARALEAAPLTKTGTVLGTAQYVSPEQASGSVLTPATDIYSLGVVAFECLAGRPPFTADNHVALALRHLNDVPPPLPDGVPAPVRDLVFDMLAKDPSARPETGPRLLDWVAALREALAAPGTAALGALTDPGGFPAARGAGGTAVLGGAAFGASTPPYGRPAAGTAQGGTYGATRNGTAASGGAGQGGATGYGATGQGSANGYGANDYSGAGQGGATGYGATGRGGATGYGAAGETMRLGRQAGGTRGPAAPSTAPTGPGRPGRR
ncbi:serine/threonine-protein kinase, partial [Microbispora sp. ATCC PTA-5024]|uniref:serine/threonine-protein kinase n=1 Tax=Microbispora sp. ATCC PTA-5024 TaxID=316330 RepID=UPI0003DC2F32